MGTDSRLRSGASQAYKVHPGGPEDDDDDDRLGGNKEFIEEETAIAITSIVKWWRLRRLHARIKSKWSPEQLRELHEARRRKRVRRRIQELIVHSVFLYVFHTATLGPFHAASPYYFMTHIRELFTDTNFIANGSIVPMSFADIRSRSQVHSWLQGPLFSTLYGGNLNPITHRHTGGLLGTGQLVGGVSIGSLRVKRSACSDRLPLPVTNDSSVYYCYGADNGQFTSATESTMPFGAGNGSDFSWSGGGIDVVECRNKFFSSINTASSTLYPCPAFAHVLPQTDSAAALSTLRALETLAYIDDATRLLVVEANVANAMLERMLVLQFVLEFPPAGGVLPSTTARLAPYAGSTFDFATQWSVVATGIFYFYFVVRVVRVARHEGWPAFRQLGLWVDGANILAYLVMWLLRSTMGLDMPSTPIQGDTFATFTPYATMFGLSEGFAAAAAFLSVVRFVLLLDILPQVSLVLHVIFAAFTEISGFLVTFGLLVYAYALAFTLVFGSAVGSFSTVTKSYGALLRSLTGDVDYAGLYAANPTAAPLFFASFTLVSVFILLTIVIAMMQDAYWRGKQKTKWDSINLVYETFTYLWSATNAMVNTLAGWCGVRAHLKPVPGLKSPEVQPTRLSRVQSLVLKPLLSTQETLNRVGAQFSQSPFVQTGVQTLKKGSTALGSAKDHLVGQLNAGAFSGGASRGPIGGAASDEQIKALQGMIVQLAHQNTKIQHTLGVLQAQLADLRGDRTGDLVTSGVDLSHGLASA
ncbi:hypothetical protein ACHHYP_00532 [Achlya hypogyna]|uniref:Uncharacterized protein n=1 Tax=Achlya hypogyna TaxID=1202772 RepID=A0A1V9ZUI5_ACHHY|nr:hypothetical protein ACHHYP_00532 [Achlya hypogyna]